MRTMCLNTVNAKTFLSTLWSSLTITFHRKIMIVDYIVLKIIKEKRLHCFMSMTLLCSSSQLLNFLTSLIQLFISYGLSRWGHTSKSKPAKILYLQKRVLCLIYFHNKRDHVLPLFLCSNILQVEMLYLKSIFLLKHDIYGKGAPPNLLDVFSQVDYVHSR